MDFSAIIDIMYTYLADVNKIAPYIFSAVLLIAFTFRQVFAYGNSMNYQEKFGIPHYRFNTSASQSILETLWYIVMIGLFIVLQYIFVINVFKIDIVLSTVCCAVFAIVYNFIIFIQSAKKMDLKSAWLRTIIISALATSAVAINLVYYPFDKDNYTMLESCLILYGVIVLTLYGIYIIVSFLYVIYKNFDENANPKSGKYEVVTIDNDMYAVLPCTNKEVVLIKLKEEKGTLHIVKSDYLIVESIGDKKVQYLDVEI